MNISSLSSLLDKLNDMKQLGGKHYKEINRLLNLEATTNNLEIMQNFVRENY